MELVKRIDIPNFGSYKGFEWKANVRNSKNEVEEFKKLNILYGRNYSGKTTLSRIFRSFETGSLPLKFLNPQFTLLTDEGKFNQAQVNSQNFDIRVYNKDFITDNLSFLNDSEGHISPIAIIGDDNTKIEKQISEKKEKLGSIDSKKGLYYQYELKKASLSKCQSKFSPKLIHI